MLLMLICVCGENHFLAALDALNVGSAYFGVSGVAFLDKQVAMPEHLQYSVQ